MKISKNLIAAGVVTTIAAGSLLGVGAASAQSTDSGDTSIIDRIATRFNLNRDEVATVFEEAHEERHEQMEQKRTEHLQGLVDDGTITAEQKTALEAKFEEMHAAREALRDQDLSRAEIREQMEAARTAFEAWADEQGIDLESIRPEGGHGGFGRGGHHFRGGAADDTSSDSDTSTDS